MKSFELYHIPEEDLYLSIDHKAKIYCQPAPDLNGYIPLYARLQIDDLYTHPIIYPGGLKLAQFFSKVSFVMTEPVSQEQEKEREKALAYMEKIHGHLLIGDGILLYKKDASGQIIELFDMIKANDLATEEGPCKTIYGCESDEMIDKFLQIVQQYYKQNK